MFQGSGLFFLPSQSQEGQTAKRSVARSLVENLPDCPQLPVSVQMTKSASGKVSFLEVVLKVRCQYTDEQIRDQVDFISLTNLRLALATSLTCGQNENRREGRH